DLDDVADAELVRLVVSQVALRDGHDLPVERVLEAPLDVDGHGLVGLVRRDAALHRLLHRASAFSLATVRSRAISRLAARILRGLEVWPIADWMRRPRSSGRRFSTAAAISSPLSLRASLDLIVDLPLDQLGLDRQLVRGEAEGPLG